MDSCDYHPAPDSTIIQTQYKHVGSPEIQLAFRRARIVSYAIEIGHIEQRVGLAIPFEGVVEPLSSPFEILLLPSCQ